MIFPDRRGFGGDGAARVLCGKTVGPEEARPRIKRLRKENAYPILAPVCRSSGGTRQEGSHS